jgi:hypothetical protein
MSETNVFTPVNHDTAPAVSENPLLGQEHSLDAARETALRNLLPYDYDDAKQSGLIDLFYHDEHTDGLLHTLAGGMRTGESGDGFVSEGYHHEPSGEQHWPHVKTGDDSMPATYVDRSHLESANSNERAKYREFPLEPYQAQVVINGVKKAAIHRHEQTGELSRVAAKNTMFPKEYDAYMVLRAIQDAYNNHDPAAEVLSEDATGAPVLVFTGQAPLLDGKSSMPIRIVADAESRKIKTAIPIAKRRPGIMKLSDEQANQLIAGNLYKPKDD